MQWCEKDCRCEIRVDTGAQSAFADGLVQQGAEAVSAGREVPSFDCRGERWSVLSVCKYACEYWAGRTAEVPRFGFEIVPHPIEDWSAADGVRLAESLEDRVEGYVCAVVPPPVHGLLADARGCDERVDR